MFVDGWVPGKTTCSTYIHGILLSLKQEGTLDTCYNIEETWSHYTKWEKAISQKDKHCMIPLIWGIQSNHTHRGRKTERWLPGMEKGKWQFSIQQTQSLLLQNEKSSVGGWWKWDEKVLNIKELYTLKIETVSFILNAVWIKNLTFNLK